MMFPARCAAAPVWLALATSLLAAQPPLHEQIDRRVSEEAGGVPLAPRSSDAEFLRRVYLDLAGRIPTRVEAERFLADSAEDKRSRLVDQLLEGPDYPRHLASQMNVMLMERLGSHPDWEQFLKGSFQANRPWDEMARDLLNPNRDDELRRGAAYFMTARLVSEGAMAETDVPGLTRDVARLLAGQDIQCAQCHNHISIDHYKQRDFQGLHAIFLNVQQDRSVSFPAVSEGLMAKKHDFMSVFVQEPEETGPRIPGVGEIEIPSFAQGEEYLVPPDRKKRTRGVPKFSPLKELAQGLASRDNRLFAENMANRLWFLMMGRGLVHPLDLHHPDNPPSHPELLAELGEQFAAHQFDIKWLLKELALSQTYQRTSRLEPGQEPPPVATFALANQKRLSAEQLLRSTLVATGELPRFVPAAAGDAGEPSKTEEKQDAVKQDAVKQDAVKQDAEKRLQALEKLFVKMFANPPREPEVEFEPSVAGTLFALNNGDLLELFQRRPGNLIDQLAALADADVADVLFLSVLSRPPTAADRADVEQFLGQAAEQAAGRDAALGQLAWAVWSSNEFFINH